MKEEMMTLFFIMQQLNCVNEFNQSHAQKEQKPDFSHPSQGTKSFVLSGGFT